MEYSTHYNLSLPYKRNGDVADIDPISDNFETIDTELYSTTMTANTTEQNVEQIIQDLEVVKETADAAYNGIERWEHIRSITLEESVASISEKIEDYGDTSKGVRVKVTVPSKSEIGDDSAEFPNTRLRAFASFRGGVRSLRVYASNWAILRDSPTMCVFDIVPVQDVWCINVNPYTKTFSALEGDITVQGNDKVRYVGLEIVTSGYTIPIGTKIDIWRLM